MQLGGLGSGVCRPAPLLLHLMCLPPTWRVQVSRAGPAQVQPLQEARAALTPCPPSPALRRVHLGSWSRSQPGLGPRVGGRSPRVGSREQSWVAEPARWARSCAPWGSSWGSSWRRLLLPTAPRPLSISCGPELALGQCLRHGCDSQGVAVRRGMVVDREPEPQRCDCPQCPWAGHLLVALCVRWQGTWMCRGAPPAFVPSCPVSAPPGGPWPRPLRNPLWAVQWDGSLQSPGCVVPALGS